MGILEMNKPTVSIIMGVYNGASRMRTAINSMIEQTFTDWEFIICDDGSSDNSLNILRDLAKKDNRIKIIENIENLGLTKTLNHCIAESTGKYIARMDDDDYSYQTRIAKQVTFLDSHLEYDLVSSSIDIFDGEKITSFKKAPHEIPQCKDFLWGSQFVHPATMFRAESIQKAHGYRFSKETRRAEDYDLFMRMYAQGMRGYNLSEPLLRYYVNPDAMRKRKYRYRLDEAVVRYKGFKLLGLFPKGIPYVIKPLLVGLIPRGMLFRIHNRSKSAKKEKTDDN